MAENKMAEVAKLLGVELNEEFGLKKSNFSYKLTTYGLLKRYLTVEEWSHSSMLEDILIGILEIVKKPKPILDEVEKRYLSNIIKPFIKDVKYIIKSRNFSGNYEYISIDYIDSLGYHEINLPYFKVGTMYRGMEIGKDYTLNELGLLEVPHGK